MFRITNTKEDHTTDAARLAQLNGTGIYCDTTAAQYGRAPELQDARAYHRHHPGSGIDIGLALLGPIVHCRRALRGSRSRGQGLITLGSGLTSQENEVKTNLGRETPSRGQIS